MLSETIILAVSALLGTAIIAACGLRAWHGWLALKAREIDYGGRDNGREIEGGAGSRGGSGMARIEIADLKERIRKLEAIASGVDL